MKRYRLEIEFHTFEGTLDEIYYKLWNSWTLIEDVVNGELWEVTPNLQRRMNFEVRYGKKHCAIVVGEPFE